MKKICIFLILLSLVLAGCGAPEVPLTDPTVVTTAAADTTPPTTAATTPPTTADTTPPTTADTTPPTTADTTPPTTMETTPPTTEPPTTADTTPPETSQAVTTDHSDLYIPGVSVEDIITYFNEVCLDAEFSSSGNPNLLQKWAEPIRYHIHGDYTEEDHRVLTEFADWLNGIEGFPGMYPVTGEDYGNLQIHFCTQAKIVDILGNNFYGVDGGVTFWYRDNKIYDSTICYSTDVYQTLRNSVILEEIYNGLGPVQDTSLRQDSIIYSGFSEPQSLTAVDEVLLKLLYHPLMNPGMNTSECEAVIRQLYY